MGWALLAVLAVDLAGLVVIYLLLRARAARLAAPDRQAAELQEEVSRLVVELNRVADRSVALLEDRVGSLNELLAAADKKLGILRREIERHDASARLYGRLAPPPVPAAAEEGGRSAAAEARERAPREPVAGRRRADRGTLREEVARLARAGLSAQLIASRVGAPLGEVELIMALGAPPRAGGSRPS